MNTRPWVALAFFSAAYFAFAPLETAVYRPLARLFGLHMIQDGLMAPLPYAALMVVRLGLDLLVVAALLAIQQRRFREFPLAGPAMGRMTLAGLLTGLAVMTAAISGILLAGSATAALARQPVASGLLHGAGWLAYAVYRTGSCWWSVGYHTGWNWASAPLFGAAGSGYLDRGHLLDFMPTGPAWITGGAVGPEGSLLAFFALAAATGLLLATPPHGAGRPASAKVA